VHINFVEKLIVLLTGLSVLMVGGTVGLLSIMPPRSGIPAVAEDSEWNTQDWLIAARAKANGYEVGPGGQTVMFQTQPEPAAGGGPGGGPPAVNEEGEPTAPAPTDYYVADSAEPAAQSEVIEGFPWLKKVPGVTYMQPKPVPQTAYQRYQSFEEGFEVAQSGGGQFTTLASGEPAYELTWLDQNSMLAQRLGLQPGDKVISVNGQPVGNSPDAGKALYDQMKGEERFAVLIERQGTRTILSYYVR